VPGTGRNRVGDPVLGEDGVARAIARERGRGERRGVVHGDDAPAAHHRVFGRGRVALEVVVRRAYGLRDEEYLRLKILPCMLPRL